MTRREEWVVALHRHEHEVARLRCAIDALGGDAVQDDAPAAREERTRRQIEYDTAQMIRHEISMALLSARLAS